MNIRQLNENDKFLLEKWIALDNDHAGKTNVDFWLPQKHTASFATEDDMGAVFYVRGETCMRLHIQFPPETEKRRIIKVLLKFIPWIEEQARQKGYKQIIWESTSDSLIEFTKHFGYRVSPNEIVKDL